jgi:hypothetical protein
VINTSIQASPPTQYHTPQDCSSGCLILIHIDTEHTNTHQHPADTYELLLHTGEHVLLPNISISNPSYSYFTLRLRLSLQLHPTEHFALALVRTYPAPPPWRVPNSGCSVVLSCWLLPFSLACIQACLLHTLLHRERIALWASHSSTEKAHLAQHWQRKHTPRRTS